MKKDAERRWMRRLVRRLRLECFFGEREWYRRLHGGKWMRTHLDFPVCSTLWLPVPDHATPNYREPLWRGTPDFVDNSPNPKVLRSPLGGDKEKPVVGGP